MCFTYKGTVTPLLVEGRADPNSSSIHDDEAAGDYFDGGARPTDNRLAVADLGIDDDTLRSERGDHAGLLCFHSSGARKKSPDLLGPGFYLVQVIFGQPFTGVAARVCSFEHEIALTDRDRDRSLRRSK